MTQIAYNLVITEAIEVLLFYTNYEFNSETSEARKLTEIAQKAKI